MMTVTTDCRLEPAVPDDARVAASAEPELQGGVAQLAAAGPLVGGPGHRAGVNLAAIASPILAIASLVTFGLAAVPAIIAGHVALRQIRRTGQGGRPAAIAGLVLAYAVVVIALYALAVIVLWGLGGGDA